MLHGRSESILDLLMSDHSRLKYLARFLRDSSTRPALKLSSAQEFLALFCAHSKFELEVLYNSLKDDRKLRAMIIEGEVEHGILDKKCSLIARKLSSSMILDEALSEELRVLAEVVSHHLKEEEEELFFYMRKEVEPARLESMGSLFLKLKDNQNSARYQRSEAN